MGLVSQATPQIGVWLARLEWDQVEVIDLATDPRERLVKKAIHIKLVPPGYRIKGDEGRELLLLWLNAIRTAQNTELETGWERDQQIVTECWVRL